MLRNIKAFQVLATPHLVNNMVTSLWQGVFLYTGIAPPNDNFRENCVCGVPMKWLKYLCIAGRHQRCNLVVGMPFTWDYLCKVKVKE